MISAPSPPPVIQPPMPSAPDPWQAAMAQTNLNVNSAVAQNQLNNVNQQTPFGSINYNQTGGSWVGGSPGTGPTQHFPTSANDPNFATGGMYANNGGWDQGTAGTQGNWVPTYTATTALSPQLQKLFNSNIGNAQQSSGLESKLLTNAQQQLSHPLDLSWGATEQKLWDLNKHTLDPQWAQAQQDLDQRLANQGLTPGSQQYGFQQGQFGLNKANAYDQALLQGHQTATSDLQNVYNSPLNVLNALRSGSQVSQPQVTGAPTASASIPAANQLGLSQSNYATQAGLFSNAQNAALQSYQAQQQAQNQAMGGLFGLGGSLLSAGIGAFSDERAKTDIKLLGTDPETGLEISAYRYKGDPKTYPKAVGPMAQDMEKKYPGTTREIGGHKIIKAEAVRKFGLGGKVSG